MLDAFRRIFVLSRERIWIIFQLALVAALHVLLTMDLNPPARSGLATGFLVSSEPKTIAFILWMLVVTISQHWAEARWRDGNRSLRRGSPHVWLPSDSLLAVLIVSCVLEDTAWLPQDGPIWTLYAVGTGELLRIWQPSGRTITFDGGVSFVFTEHGGERIVAKLPAPEVAASLDPYGQLVASARGKPGGTAIILDSRPTRNDWHASSLPRILQVTVSSASRRCIEAAASVRKDNETPLRLLLELRRAWALVVVAAVACLDGGADLRLGRFIPFVLGFYVVGAAACVISSWMVFGRAAKRLSSGGTIVMLDGFRGSPLVLWALPLFGMTLAAAIAGSQVPLSASFEILDRLMAKLDRDFVLAYALLAILVMGRFRALLEGNVRRSFSAITSARIEDGEVILARPFAIEVHRSAAVDVEASQWDDRASLCVGERRFSGRLVSDNKAWRYWVEALKRAQAWSYR